MAVKVLTGDNDLVTRKVCKDVGLDTGEVLLGSAVETMSDQQLCQAVETTQVFARLSPTHKQRIVEALRHNGHVVGFMGDGINDAPALRAADVGLSVDNAVDIAKESADMILLEKNLMVLEEGVLEGRKVFVNILKYIRMGASSNFGNMFSVLGASAFLPYQPMLPIQILTNNLLYDFSQVAIPTDNVNANLIAKPQPWDMGEITRFILFIGPVSSIFDYTTFFVMLYLVPLLGPGGRGPVSHRLVCGIADDPDPDHPRHPHAADSVHPGARQHGSDDHDRDHHGHCAPGCPIRRWRDARLRAAAGAVLAHSPGHAHMLRRAHATGEDVAHPQEMALTRLSQLEVVFDRF